MNPKKIETNYLKDILSCTISDASLEYDSLVDSCSNRKKTFKIEERERIEKGYSIEVIFVQTTANKQVQPRKFSSSC